MTGCTFLLRLLEVTFFFPLVMLIYMQLSKGNLIRHPPSPSPSAPIPTSPFLCHPSYRLISQQRKPGECSTYSLLKEDLWAWFYNLQCLFLANGRVGMQDFIGCAQPFAESQLGHCHTLLQHCITGRLLPIHFVVDLGEGTWFHGSHPAAMSVLCLVEAIGSTRLVQGIKRSQMLS